MVIVDVSGAVVYPVSADVVGDDVVQGNPLAGAWQLEFTARQYSEAAQFYDRFLADNDLHVAIAAIMGKSRCLSRLGRLDEAIECCRKAALLWHRQKVRTRLCVSQSKTPGCHF